MDKKKDPRGRKPVKDKKVAIRFYVNQSKIKRIGGVKRVNALCVDFIDEEYTKIVNYANSLESSNV